MTSKNHDEMVIFFENLFLKFGYSPKSLGWDKGKQFLRFHQLTNGLDLNSKTILDVGCGFGDFVDYLNIHKVNNFKYHGIDLVSSFIKTAKSRHESMNTKFYNDRFEIFSLDFQPDISIASGIFNHKIDNMDPYGMVEKVMNKMFEHSTEAISLDFLSDKVDFLYDHNFYYDPEKILHLSYKLTRNLIFRNDFFPFEFSITLFKDNQFRKETTIFSRVEESLLSNLEQDSQ